jgi:tRNA modification GTPase
MSDRDTIAAPATPPGEGALAVIRVSGPDALGVADRCFRPAGRNAPPPSAAASHTLHYGRLVRDGAVVDEVMLAVLRAPRTFTREDTVEVACHGGLLVTRLALGAVLAAGARAAEPGEFTRRAFLNGRLDLAQAEAVADLIRAHTGLAAAAAREQLGGALSRKAGAVREMLMLTLAHVEAHLDFPDEDIAPDTAGALLARLHAAARDLSALLAGAHEGRLLRRGVRAALIGRPNAGKSSLLNQLLGRDRAIVSPVAGTTRDTIEEAASLHGLPVVLVDTAGLRATADALEHEGVRRSREAAAGADLLVHVLDAAEPLHAEDAALLAEHAGRPRVIVAHKADLPRRLELPAGLAAVAVSSLAGTGLAALKDALRTAAGFGKGADSPELLINGRHEDALRRTLTAAQAAVASLSAGASLDLVASDLRIAVRAVGEVTGQTSTEDLLDLIFSQFCLGK